MKRKDFEQCIKQGTLIKIDIDKDLAIELIALAQHRLSFWNSVKQNNKTYPSLFIEGHYEIIKELCTAILTLDGWKALDHECMFAYLKRQRSEIESDFDYLLELKDTRNDIDYRGVMFSYATWVANELKINLAINVLKEYLATRLESL